MLLTKAFGLTFTQGEVDFVIPTLDKDLPLCIDPFLLFKSRNGEFREQHIRLMELFDHAFDLFEDGKIQELSRLIDFPEANEIGMGYSTKGMRGRGLGEQLNTLFVETLTASEALRQRRLRHVEELQLLSVGVGSDRISDIAADALKAYLIEYTQKQAALWNIPLTNDLPVEHVLDVDSYEWSDGYYDLPCNPINGRPILLVPRRMVRLLPWINYDDYVSTDYTHRFLRAKQQARWARFPGTPRKAPNGVAQAGSRPGKSDVVKVTRGDLSVLDQYVARKERESAKAVPAIVTRSDLGLPVKPMAEDFRARLESLPTGPTAAGDYQRLVFEILNYLFEPDLTDGELEVRTIDGTERRDIIYTNESELSFLDYVRNTYHSPFVMYEVKNVAELEMNHLNQTAAYLGVRLGHLGFIVARRAQSEPIQRKAFAIFNDTATQPRKILIILSDEDLVTMLHERDAGGTAASTKYLQKKYREFRTKVQ
ncbi:MAG: hypothetical protein KJ048_16645 [Dehalococcoidia bacterium]|nr:hypothetical protein [Dehalococcoidia bacterium]